MSRQKKKRNKKHRPRPAGSAPMLIFLHAIAEVFRPIYNALDELETEGTISVDDRGRAIYIDSDGNPVDFADSLFGMVTAYGIYARRHGINLNTAPLSQLAARLDYGTAITPLETRPARSAIDRLRQVTMSMSADEGRALLRDLQLKIALDEKVAA